MLSLLMTLMLLQSGDVTGSSSSTQHGAASSMGKGAAMAGYGGQISGYNTRAHPPEPQPHGAGMVGGGSEPDKPLPAPSMGKPVGVNRLVDRDGARWDLIPGYGMYRNATTGEVRYRPPPGSTPVKVKPKT